MKKDIQKICDDCCDGVNINGQYVGEVFQWLIDNGYTVTKNDMSKEDEENIEDLKSSRLIFVQTLDALLPLGTGVLVELHGKALELGYERVIVHNDSDNNEIGVILADERTDLKHGDRVRVIDENLLNN